MTSVAGGIVGYAIGFFLFEVIGKTIVSTYGLEEEMARVAELFEENAYWAIFIAGFSPLPYKLFTLGGGLFNISFTTFVFASILGRAARFYLVSYLAYKFGKRLGGLVFTYFNFTSILVALIIVLLVILWKIV